MSSYCTMHCYIVIYRGALCKRYKLRIVVVLLQCRSFATNAALTACAQFKSGCQIPDNQSLFQSVKGRRAILPLMSPMNEKEWIGLNRPQIHKGGKLEAGRCGDHRRWERGLWKQATSCNHYPVRYL